VLKMADLMIAAQLTAWSLYLNPCGNGVSTANHAKLAGITSSPSQGSILQ
jgi:hypothetical protein